VAADEAAKCARLPREPALVQEGGVDLTAALTAVPRA